MGRAAYSGHVTLNFDKCVEIKSAKILPLTANQDSKQIFTNL